MFFDHLANENPLDNGQLAQFLDVSLASFTRLKHQLQGILRKDCRLKLDAKTNLLVGEEADIRQVLYEFYFTLSVYPEGFWKKVKELCQNQTSVPAGNWQLNNTWMNQWFHIAKIRVTKGKFLPENNTELCLQETLIQSFDRQVTVSLPDHL
ncbi:MULTISPECIES: helix-turn-helix domain-containing protein [Enterococcus]|uniref:Mga helix-turn-helix domain-containing protein n=1 Tax=Enterococcus mundtii TaxID=53346 RepID=A0A242KFL2_ENTMU|nr:MULTISPECIES: helix-turn-helix domain-containing protein [Enterococcus]OTP19961.1 hypothetical protein A5802_003301 [Enterococcus mundtii]